MKILVVEDEIFQEEWLTRDLSNAVHEVTAVCDGDWALTLWRSQRLFDVVVTENLLGGKTIRNVQPLIESSPDPSV